MERRAGRFRAHLLLQCAERAPLLELVSALIPLVNTLPNARKVRWSVDIDPQDLS